MIVFDLKCRDGHTFEEWFASSADSEAKLAAHQLRCPTCGDSHLQKAVSAARVASGASEPAVGPCGLPACAGGVCQMSSSAR
jgi:hypothetical protein